MDVHPCSACGATLQYLGILGRRVYGRCRQCGSIEGLPVCHECIGNGELYDERSATWEVCSECGGTGERATSYPSVAAAARAYQRATTPERLAEMNAIGDAAATSGPAAT